MRAPEIWPFSSPVVPANQMPSGHGYRADSNGLIYPDPLDVGVLIGYGFCIYRPPVDTESFVVDLNELSPTILSILSGACL